MKRKTLYSVYVIVLLVFFAVAGMSSWLLGTSEGASWLIQRISSWTGVTIEFRRLDGKLWDAVLLEGIQVHSRHGHAAIETLSLEWHPLMLLTGSVAVKKLLVRNALIQDNRPEEKKPVDLGWPEIGGLPGKIDAWIDNLDIRGFDYYRLDETHLRINRLSALVQWHEATMSLSNVIYITPDVDIRGALAAGFKYPSLRAVLDASLAQPFQDIKRFTLKIKLLPGQGDEQLRGAIDLRGMKGNEQLASLSSELGIAKTALNISSLHVEQADRRGSLGGNGWIDFSTPEPAIDFSFEALHLDLKPEIQTPTDISGTLFVKGKIQEYSGKYVFTNEGNTKYEAALSGSFRGGHDAIHVEISGGSLLGGTLQGSVLTSWRDGISLKGDLRARNMNPASVSKKWSGIINVNLAAEIMKPDEGDMAATIDSQILQSRLRSKELAGELHARVHEDSILIRNSFLKGNGFDIHAEGDIRKRLSFHADISDLSGLIPDAEGQLSLHGWVSRKRKLLSGSVDARGNGIKADGIHLRELAVNGLLSEREGSPLRLKADISGLDYQKIRFRTVSLALQGRPESHDIKINVDFPGSAFQSDFTGAYLKGAWSGKILRASYKDSTGIMKLSSAAELFLSKDRLHISPLHIKGPLSESISLEGEMMMRPMTGFVKTEWRQLNLNHANEWLEDAALRGRATGYLSVAWKTDDLTDIDTENTASGALTVREKTVDIENSQFHLHWNSKGLRASVHGRFSEGGMLRVSLQSSSPPGFDAPPEGTLDTTWNEVNIAMANTFLPERVNITGNTSGSLQAKWAKREISFMSGEVHASGTIASHEHHINIKETSVNLAMSEKKIITHLNLALMDGGALDGRFVFPIPVRFVLPEQGTVDARLDGVNLSLLRSWMPEGLEVNGILSGQLKGTLMGGSNVDVSGSASILQGSVLRTKEKRKLSVDLRNAEVTWLWSGNALQGDIRIALTEYGTVTGKFELPVAARVPPTFRKKDPLFISIDADVRERGLLTSLFPGLIRESHGSLKMSGRIDGTWEHPDYKGSIHLKDAGAFFPAAGIILEDVSFQGHFGKQTFVLDAFTVKSGGGSINGDVTMMITNWKISQYKGHVTGKNFRTIHLPELQCSTSPELTFEGSPKNLSVRGKIEIPELFVYGSDKPDQVKPSDDVVIVDEEKKPEKKFPFALDIAVHIALGKSVFVKAQGIDAQLEGDVSITAQNPEEIYGKGLIKVKKGDFRRYGINLTIQRGRLIFSGLVTRPTLDVIALRTIGDVKAGVTVSGTPQSPEVKLYSEPPMPDTDILAYIVLGHPLGEDTKESSAMLQAAGLLLSQGESVVLQEKIKRTFGIDVLDIQAGGGELNRSLLTVGKYLTPRLFISYGQSLFGEGGLFRLRYSLTRHWEIETQTGEEMGGDIYYKIDFK